MLYSNSPSERYYKFAIFRPAESSWRYLTQGMSSFAETEEQQNHPRQLGQFFPMALVQVSRILFESGVCWVKWWRSYNKIVNKSDIVIDMELIFGKLITHDKIKLV